MQTRIDRMYRGDCALIITALVVLWLVLAGMMAVVAGIAGNLALRLVALGAGLGAAMAATTGMLAVISHLKRHKTALYSEDIACTRQALEAHGTQGA